MESFSPDQFSPEQFSPRSHSLLSALLSSENSSRRPFLQVLVTLFPILAKTSIERVFFAIILMDYFSLNTSELCILCSTIGEALLCYLVADAALGFASPRGMDPGQYGQCQPEMGISERRCQPNIHRGVRLWPRNGVPGPRTSRCLAT
jgi:hypothetical protein